MARIAGVNIPTQKRVEIALTYIHGIGRTMATNICQQVGIPPLVHYPAGQPGGGEIALGQGAGLVVALALGGCLIGVRHFVDFDALLTKLGNVFRENRPEVACLILCRNAEGDFF